jgi:hypothetical protein
MSTLSLVRFKIIIIIIIIKYIAFKLEVDTVKLIGYFDIRLHNPDLIIKFT